jgi:hypothetical protein
VFHGNQNVLVGLLFKISSVLDVKSKNEAIPSHYHHKYIGGI